jgi:hypothetical protein
MAAHSVLSNDELDKVMAKNDQDRGINQITDNFISRL